jgi:hypothetical protein
MSTAGNLRNSFSSKTADKGETSAPANTSNDLASPVAVANEELAKTPTTTTSDNDDKMVDTPTSSTKLEASDTPTEGES